MGRAIPLLDRFRLGSGFLRIELRIERDRKRDRKPSVLPLLLVQNETGSCDVHALEDVTRELREGKDRVFRIPRG